MKYTVRTYFFLFALFLIFSNEAVAFTLSGYVRSVNNEPVPFVTIHIKGTTTGVTTNTDGFYALEIPQGKYKVVYQSIGYLVQTIDVNVISDLTLDIVLKEDAVQLKEVEVIPGKEDPAFAIIRKAMKKRESYLKQVNRYECDVYIKGLQRIKRYPKKIMGREINLDNVIDTASGIVYLSESVSKFYFEQPDKIREFLVSSKVSGKNNAFSFNQASDLLFNFYQNLIQTSVTPRGIISPIAGTCLLSYNYRFTGSFYENGVWVNKIQVTPKRKSDPCFSGYIYICDSTWRIYNVDVFVTKENQVRFVDTLRISQVYLPVNDSVWMPFSNKFSFNFGVFGFEGNGYFTGIQSNYLLNPEVSKRFFNGEEWHVNEGSNKKENTYWDSIRPIPLTHEETLDYERKDSLHRIWDSPRYKDSLDKRNNRLQLNAFWEGYSWRSTRKGINFRTAPLLTGFLYNTVQGWNPGLTLFFSKRMKETKKEFQSECRSYYGLSSFEFFISGEVRYEYNPKTNSRITLSGGREASQFNAANPISPFVNCVYSLLDKHNYMKLYRNEFGSIRWRSEPFNGLTFFTSVLFSARSPLQNSSDFSWVKRSYDFASNDPGNFHFDSLNFTADRKAEISFGIRVRPGQRYYLLPNEKVNIRSKYPEFSLNYTKAIPSVFGSRVEYDLLVFSVADRLNLKRFGRAEFLFRGGKFFNTKNMQFMDYKHFSGNQTYFTDFDLQKFQLLDYYKFSTRNYFLEGWYSQNLGGFFLNSIPLVKKLKLEEILTLRYAYMEKLSHYFEFSTGLRYLLARLDYVWSINSGKVSNGIRFGFLF